MATDTVSSTPSIERICLAKLASEEISAIMAAHRGLKNLSLDETQQRLVTRTLLNRIEELADIAWVALADDAVPLEDLTTRFELSGPIEY